MAAPTTISALPQSVTLALYAGDDFTLTLTVTSAADGTPVDLTGATVAAQIRATAAAVDPPLASFTPSISANVIALHLSAADSASLPSKAVWDCQLTAADGTVSTLAAGPLTLAADVTRP